MLYSTLFLLFFLQDKSVKDVVGTGVVEVLSANTTINVAVPDALIGSVFGKQVQSRSRLVSYSRTEFDY